MMKCFCGENLRKFAFQELAYAIVVATSYGLFMGMWLTGTEDVIIFFLWAILICLHLGGIYLIIYLEEQKAEKQSMEKKQD